MNGRRFGKRLVMPVLALLLTGVLPLADASSPENKDTAGYAIQAQLIGAGGTTTSGANGLALDSAIGQSNATTLSGANGLSLAGGFWNAQVQSVVGDRIFANGFE